MQNTQSLLLCVCIPCAQLWHTIQHRTVLIILSLNLQTIIIALMMSCGQKREKSLPEASDNLLSYLVLHYGCAPTPWGSAAVFDRLITSGGGMPPHFYPQWWRDFVVSGGGGVRALKQP